MNGFSQVGFLTRLEIEMSVIFCQVVSQIVERSKYVFHSKDCIYSMLEIT